jgi:uncharacterized protein
MRLRFLGVVLLLVSFQFQAMGSIVGKDETIFFPKKYGEKLELYKSFRTLWWNFLVVEAANRANDPPDKLIELCGKLRESNLVDRAECGGSLKELLPIAEDWARTIPTRRIAPSSSELNKAFSARLAQASLPLPKELLTLLRIDPLGSFHDLEKHALERQPILLKRKSGFFIDEDTNRWAIPFRPVFPPQENEKTSKIFELIGETLPQGSWWVVGSHASSAENRKQIENDLARMSSIGTLFLVIFVAIVWRLRRLRLLWGVPMTFLGEGLGALATIVVFGSIHGLVLSFGIGIMGLLLDYTFHGAFKSKSTQVWRSNLMGLLTTLAAFFVLAFSQIPLLRQLAFFSVVGLTSSFGLIYLVNKLFADKLAVEPINTNIRDYLLARWVVAFLGAGLGFSLWVFQPAFDMRQFDFQSPRTRELYSWLQKHIKYKQTLLEVLPGEGESALKEAQKRVDWATVKGIDVENMSVYVKPLEIQEENLKSWRNFPCQTRSGPQFFEPFFKATECDNLRPISLTSPPLYLADLTAKNRWLNIWFPENKSVAEEIQRDFPEATSFIDLVNEFPQTITRELAWMIPCCFFLILTTLWIYYRRLMPALAALIPFLVGLGAVAWARLLGMPFSFVSLIGVTMLLGLGTDYGIFSVDHDLFVTSKNSEGGSEKGLTSALIFAALTTIAGYLPLLFCGHQVLVHLGQVLSIGTLGSMLGAFWATPRFLRWVSK